MKLKEITKTITSSLMSAPTNSTDQTVYGSSWSNFTRPPLEAGIYYLEVSHFPCATRRTAFQRWTRYYALGTRLVRRVR